MSLDSRVNKTIERVRRRCEQETPRAYVCDFQYIQGKSREALEVRAMLMVTNISVLNSQGEVVGQAMPGMAASRTIYGIAGDSASDVLRNSDVFRRARFVLVQESNGYYAGYHTHKLYDLKI
ncbi:MAG: hypothetical protein AB1668_06625 [Nanoarchaeota archaeon]